MSFNLLRAAILSAIVAGPAAGQSQAPVSREDAVTAALARGARFGVAVADTTAAYARLVSARAFQNPVLSATYSRAYPTWHYLAELPFDLPGQRSARVASARAARLSAHYRFAFERAAVALDADTTYTLVLAAQAHAALSRRNALDSDSLRWMVVTRRDAGDASDLDVELATVTAGQAANVAAADSLAFLSSLLDLQVVMGLAADRVAVVPTDSLTMPTASGTDSSLPSLASPLQVAAASAALESARLAVRLQRRSVFAAPSLVGGFETGDPDQPGALPTFGLSLALPLFNRNRGPVMEAEADQARARAELSLAEVEGRAAIERVRRTLAIARATLARDRVLVTAADRVASMSLTAYREGASSLPTVLEAQRNAREVQAQYVDDLAAAWIAQAELRVLTLTAERAP